MVQPCFDFGFHFPKLRNLSPDTSLETQRPLNIHALHQTRKAFTKLTNRHQLPALTTRHPSISEFPMITDYAHSDTRRHLVV